MSDAKEEFLNLISTIMNNHFDLGKLYPNSEDLEIILEQIADLKKSLDSFRVPTVGVNSSKSFGVKLGIFGSGAFASPKESPKNKSTHLTCLFAPS